MPFLSRNRPLRQVFFTRRDANFLLSALLAAVVALTGCEQKASEPPPKFQIVGKGDGKLPPGRWTKIDSDSPAMTPEQREAARQLEALGYLDGTQEAPQEANVTRYLEGHAWDGYNFFTSGHGPEAILMDMHGEVVHQWAYDYENLWPELDVRDDAIGQFNWRRAHLYPNGDILAIHEGIGMIRLDKDSNLVWQYPGKAHHDMHVMDDGRIYVLTREAKMIPRINPDQPVQDDFIAILSPEGEELRRISVLKCLENAGAEELLSYVNANGELFHTNSIEVLDGRLAERSEDFAAGNVLLSLPLQSTIAVVNPEDERLVWSMRGAFTFQHHPTILENGNMLFFDNRGLENRSTVYEVDPVTKEVKWFYRGTQQEPFFSYTCGSCYRLPNGNTLITESDPGRAFEVNPYGKIVWEFLNPYRAGPGNQYIATLFDLQRIRPEKPFDWVAEK